MLMKNENRSWKLAGTSECDPNTISCHKKDDKKKNSTIRRNVFILIYYCQYALYVLIVWSCIICPKREWNAWIHEQFLHNTDNLYTDRTKKNESLLKLNTHSLHRCCFILKIILKRMLRLNDLAHIDPLYATTLCTSRPHIHIDSSDIFGTN